MGDKREARYKLFRIDPNQVLAMLNWNTYQSIALPIVRCIPDGAYTDAMDYSISRQCFMMRVYHKDFDIVPTGELIPIADEWVEVEERVVSVDAYRDTCNMRTAIEEGSRLGKEINKAADTLAVMGMLGIDPNK